MDSRNIRGIIGLVVVTLLSFGVILGTKAVTGGTGDGNGGSASEPASVGRELKVSGTPGMERAVHLSQGGYETVVKTKGYGGDITMQVNFREDKKTLESVAVLEQSETEGLGARISEEDFLGQFRGMEAPVSLGTGYGEADGDKTGEEAAREEQRKALEELDGAKFRDGTYVAKGEPDDTGFTDVVSVTIEEGRITGVTWDGVTEDGQSKAKLSETGEYTMTEDGLTWKEQAEALAAALVESQELTALSVDDKGKTDAVAGVSISIGGFLDLAGECLRESAGQQAQESSAQVSNSGDSQMDGITGATISSGAVAEGINLAYEFLRGAEE